MKTFITNFYDKVVCRNYFTAWLFVVSSTAILLFASLLLKQLINN